MAGGGVSDLSVGYDKQCGAVVLTGKPTYQRRIAIRLYMLRVEDIEERKRRAREAFKSVAFRGCLRAAISWLLVRDIPLSCKVREVVLVPVKLWRFLSGRTTEAALLEWRAS